MADHKDQKQGRGQQQPPFDIDAYAARYDPRSETRLQRLLFLARHFHERRRDDDGGDGDGGDNVDGNDGSSSAASIAGRAYDLAVRRMRESGNHRRYLEEYGAVEAAPPTPGCGEGGGDGAPELVGGGGGTGTPVRPHHPAGHPQKQHVIQHYLDYDPEFPRASRRESRMRQEALEGRLAAAQGHLMKESIRAALLALAEFHGERGELREAWRRVARSREYCANGRQHTHVCLLLVELGVDLREWSSVRDAISRAEHTVMGESDNDPLFHHKLRVGQALAHLAEGRYLDAAKSVTSISPDLTNQFNTVVSAEDLALYGAVLGLATLDRATLHGMVIDGPFKGRLELVPAMREALRHYSRAEYGQCLALLHDTIERDLLLDIHLHSHVPTLLNMIRDRCIVQYFQPYSSVSLERMGRVFGLGVGEMEEVVARLIGNGGVDGMSLGEGARINALEKTLSVEGPRSVERKARRRARVMAAKMGVQFTRNAEGMIMRIVCIENGVTIQNDKRSAWRNRSGGRARDGGRHGHEHSMGPDPFDSDESISDDAMDIDNHIVNPNEF